MALAWQVRVGYPQPAVELTYIKPGRQPLGDAGDPYNGYDRFGRSQQLRWQKTTTGRAQLALFFGFCGDVSLINMNKPDKPLLKKHGKRKK